MTPLQFVDKWRPVTLTERAAAQSHFIDLCRLLDHPTPIEADPRGDWFTFEKGVHKAGGGKGFADVWMKNHFAWEYKKKHRDLDVALGQLSRYALALESPPLQIVCDTDRFRIVTAYTNSAPKSYDLSLEDLLDPKKLSWLEAAFRNPKKLKPGASRIDLTKEAADRFSALAIRLQSKGHDAEQVGHFVNRLVFLFFAEDVGLLSDGLFRKAVGNLSQNPAASKDLLTGLFRTFRTGGYFGLDRLPHINGGLFDDREALPLDEHEIGLLKAASSQDWAHIDPTIFGTLFERFLDPDKRAQIGAHYTDAGKIGQIVEPVILRPLREEWQAARADIKALVKKALAKGAKSKDWQRAEERRSAFLERLRTLSILDPACGSGNFLYLVLHGVKDLEHAANQECESMGLPPRMPMVGPEILRGIEVNPLAAELARTTIWIGDIQWAIQNGIRSRPEPILRRLDTIEARDALLAGEKQLAGVGAARVSTPVRSKWPPAEFIIGNPPFLGGKLIRRHLGSAQTDNLYDAFRESVPGEADLVTYWIEQVKGQFVENTTKRAGFVTTNSIRSGSNRIVLQNLIEHAPIFEAYSDEPWIIDGANVRVSILCFANNEKSNSVRLDGCEVPFIRSDLTSSVADLTTSAALNSNASICFQGPVKVGGFDIPGSLARKMITLGHNPNRKENREVVKLWANGIDIVRRPSDTWIIDFGMHSQDDASMYEMPFEYVMENVLPERKRNKDRQRRENWWRLGRSGSDLKQAISRFSRVIITPRVSKHRIFVWRSSFIVPDSAVVAIARDDDTTFGILHSRFHEMWSLGVCSWLGVGNDPRYTPSTCFETFPFPEGLTPNLPAASYADDPRAVGIARAAVELDRLRETWLNPPGLVRVEPEVVPGYPDRVLPRDAAAAAELKKRTLTNLYNARPTWLAKAHERLDRAVVAAYGWPEDISTEDALARLLELNRERAAAQGKA